MTLKEFKQSMGDWHCYVDNAGGPKAMDRFPEDEQDSFYNGCKATFPDIFAERNMDKCRRISRELFSKGITKVCRKSCENSITSLTPV